MLKLFDQVHDLVHVDDMITAITDKKGSKDFRDKLDGTIIGTSTELLIVVVVD